VYKNPADAAATGEALKFFDWAYKNGAQMAESLDYVPMPKSVVEQVEQYWTQNVQKDGKPVFAPERQASK
jgi:phosphate transport system substrate-binding protein